MERALAPENDLPDAARARALAVVGILSFIRGELGRAAAALEEGVALARAAGDAEAYIPVLMMRGSWP